MQESQYNKLPQVILNQTLEQETIHFTTQTSNQIQVLKLTTTQAQHSCSGLLFQDNLHKLALE